MRAVAHSPSFAKKVGIPQAVGRKFESHRADGPKEPEMKKSLPPFLMKKEAKNDAKKPAKKMMGGGMAYAKGGESKGKTKVKPVKMAYGGKAC